jgi:hypothetical protein
MFGHTQGAEHGQSKPRTSRIASPVRNHLEADWETVSAGGRHGRPGLAISWPNTRFPFYNSLNQLRHELLHPDG